MNEITAHSRVRDEPFIFFTIASVAPYVKKVLVFDTGSTDKTIDDIKLAQKTFGNVELHTRELPNGQHWSIPKLNERLNNPGHHALGDIRREMHNMTETEFIWILDGDEVYPNGLAEKVVETAHKNMYSEECLCAHVPVLDFYQDFGHIHHRHSFGRLFRTKKTEIKGGVPGEMHHSKVTGLVLDQSPSERMNISHSEFMHHHELFVKPWRRTPYHPNTYSGFYPEVYCEYEDLFRERLGKWNVDNIIFKKK